MLFRSVTVLLVACAALASPPAAAQQDRMPQLASDEHPLPQATDFNLITAIDVSDSITRQEENLEYNGLAQGVLDEEFLNRVAEGPARRIGFTAYTWSSGGQVGVVVPWTVIETRADAERVAAMLAEAPRKDRTAFGRYMPMTPGVGRTYGGMTDIAEAMNSAIHLSLSSPYTSQRTIINILSNGVDNNGQDPTMARDRALHLGMTINGIVFGDRDDLADYFQQNIVGGPGSFLMTIEKAEDLPQALRKKFWQDLMAGLAGRAAG